MTTLVWLRRDLRLMDNPALHEASFEGAPIVPVYIWAPDEQAPWAPGSASRVWIHHALADLAARLEECGSRLIIRRGPSLEVLRALIRETGATRVFWNRLYEPAIRQRDERIKAALRADGVEARSFQAAILFEPHRIATQAGTPCQVFTPFWKRALTLDPPARPLPEPVLQRPENWPASDPPESLGLLPSIPWDSTIRAAWDMTERGALARLRAFLSGPVRTYGRDRDRPDLDGTSCLSPWLHHGQISPRTIWHETKDAEQELRGEELASAEHFLREVGWREFAHNILYHFPHTDRQPLRPEFARFPWADDPEGLEAWQKGQTGYPIVDAGMRQLWATGWMHNRVRMIVASFLTKHQLLPWLRGAEWFWDTLVDADLAQNTLGWQWTAGCGADAAPYFRIFNPISQGEKFDVTRAYVRRWVPELARLPEAHLFAPWEAPPGILRQAGVELGGNYPRPVVDHTTARERALAAFEALRQPAQGRA